MRPVVDAGVEAEFVDDVVALLSPPAMPIARQPVVFANCPTTLPTAPLAAETRTVSPALGSQMRLRPYHAVTPGMPTTPRYADMRHARGVHLPQVAAVGQPVFLPAGEAHDRIAHGNAALLEATTTPAVPPSIVSPIVCGGGVGLRLVHASAHVRIEREVMDLAPAPARAGGGEGYVLEAEVVGGRLALRAAGKDDAQVVALMSVSGRRRSGGSPWIE